jgi:GAF domain-containing protein
MEYPLLPDTRSEAGLPLRAGTQVIGALDMQSVEQAAFSPEDVTVLQTLADQLATAIENLRLVERLQSTLQEISIFYQEQVRASWSLQTLERRMAYEFDQMRIRPIDQMHVDWPNTLLLDPSTDLPSDESRRKGALVIPVMLRGEMIGQIGVESDDPNHLWNEDEIAIIQATANQAAVTLENARLLAETQRQAQREQTMAQIAAQVRTHLDLDSVLQTAIREIGQAMNINDIEIRLGQLDATKNTPAAEKPGNGRPVREDNPQAEAHQQDDGQETGNQPVMD